MEKLTIKELVQRTMSSFAYNFENWTLCVIFLRYTNMIKI